MKAKIRELHQKYGEYVFRLALSVFFDIGMKNIKRHEIDKECEKIVQSTPKNALVTGEMQANIYRCAYELSKMTVWDILKYVRTDLEIEGAIVHPGMIVQFRQSANDREIMTVVLPPEITEGQVEDLLDGIEREVETHIGTNERVHYENCIKEQLKNVNLRCDEFQADKVFYI